MNLSKLFEMQKVLDDRIIKDKGLEGQDLFPNTVLALQVELGELANEGRWFKHWSDDQKPRTKAVRVAAMMEDDKEYYNPVLEEYVDCLHFFLSIAIQKGWQDAMYLYEDAIEESKEDGLHGGLTGAFLEVQYHLTKSYMEKHPKLELIAGFHKNEMFFRSAWYVFILIGLIGFGFTFEQMEQAYINKNQINHERQSTGY